MYHWILHWLLSGIALFIVAKILPGIEVDSLEAAFIAALLIGLVSATVGLILKIILLPFIIVTLGLVYFLVNGLMLKIASEFVTGFRVNGCLPAVLGSILLTVVDYVLNRVVGLRWTCHRPKPPVIQPRNVPDSLVSRAKARKFNGLAEYQDTKVGVVLAINETRRVYPFACD